jgi:D-3-phosphoglycerate dehydrogenase
MPWKILVSAPYIQPVISDFRRILEAADPEIQVVVPEVRERLSEDELLGLIGDIDGVICGDDAFTERVLQAAPKLKVISKWGTGIDSIDQEAAARLGIAVCNTTDAFTQAVADSVLGYMLCFARRLPWMDRDIRSGRWVKPPGFTLGEATLGIIGVGNIGRAIVRRAVGFGMPILGNDVAPVSAEFLAETGLEMVEKEELLARSDFVTLNCDLNASTHHLMGQTELAAMKTSAYLINAARGPLVDEAALVWALRNGVIAGAALDVFEIEPLPEDSGLLSLDNCLLAPHNSNSSPEAYERVHKNTIKNLLDHLTTADSRGNP